MKERIAALLREGQAAARNGEKSKARRKFRAALALDSTSTIALLWLAWLNKDPRASLAYITRVLARDPNNPRAHAALRWARRRMLSTPRAPSPPPAAPEPHRWPGYLAVGVILIILTVIIASVLIWSLPINTPVLAALAPTLSPTATATIVPTPTDMPSPTSTLTPTPTPSPTSSPTKTPSPTPTLTPTPNILPTAPPLPPPAPLSPSSVHGNVRWIDIDLTQQRLTAYEGQTLVRAVAVSTGLPYTPTPIGQFRIWTKLRYDDMSGPSYYLPNVPYVMYFYRGYGLHGTYWHSNFGHPMSHGCVNLFTPDAEWLFNWASIGTLVNIHY
ncbi:MAG: hypothetical protein DRI77_03980 [Chloroflexi bacterium]|nr:MAG: hypothetical protein DRI77_03980 [Chloroflexota bacterium]